MRDDGEFGTWKSGQGMKVKSINDAVNDGHQRGQRGQQCHELDDGERRQKHWKHRKHLVICLGGAFDENQTKPNRREDEDGGWGGKFKLKAPTASKSKSVVREDEDAERIKNST